MTPEVRGVTFFNKVYIKEKNYFKQDAKTIVDMLFEAKLFKDHITRDDMNVTEALIESISDLKAIAIPASCPLGLHVIKMFLEDPRQEI